MTFFELDSILNQFYQNYKNEWEKTRFLAYTFTAPYSNNKNYKPTDVIKFEWDNDKEIELVNGKPKDFEESKAKMLEYLKSKNKLL